ncbi:hypothetical protein OUZ56_012592 [Daphnia magna]|uniref:Uncharacterized protein n=1 Tax=Daphnia magna TaxID=35525 RepID=A0ABQ9Z4N4_9CRUS|nr:hypothetical protein OUZ56_012592 [Daphnia magna]
MHQPTSTSRNTFPQTRFKESFHHKFAKALGVCIICGTLKLRASRQEWSKKLNQIIYDIESLPKCFISRRYLAELVGLTMRLSEFVDCKLQGHTLRWTGSVFSRTVFPLCLLNIGFLTVVINGEFCLNTASVSNGVFDDIEGRCTKNKYGEQNYGYTQFFMLSRLLLIEISPSPFKMDLPPCLVGGPSFVIKVQTDFVRNHKFGRFSLLAFSKPSSNLLAM